MNLKDTKSCNVRKRPHRGDQRKKPLTGVIYLSERWVGMPVKVVKRSLWVSMVKRLHKIEAALKKVQRIAKSI